MGNICINFGGGGGISSDDVTTTRDTVLTGYKTLMTDSNDEPVEGAIPVHSGNVKAEQVYLDDNKVTFGAPYGYSRFNNSSNDMRSYRTYGELAAAIGLTSNKVAINNSILGIAGTYKGLGNVTAAQVLSGYTFSSSSISNGTGTLSISSVVSFKVAQYSSYTVIASWANPSRGPWSGLRVICKQGGYPSNVNDGTLFYEGSGTSGMVTLAGGVWYFRAWNYITTNYGRMYGSYIDGGSINNVIVHGQQVFTSSGTFSVPVGVTSVDIFGVGGGSGGNSNNTVNNDGAHPGGGGGGSGYTTTIKGVSVSSGQVLNVSIGSGGAGGVFTGRKPWDVMAGSRGGDTTVTRSGTTLQMAKGGVSYATYSAGGSGGSGGGAGYDYPRDLEGGSDGSNGGSSGHYNVGYGQHTTTRAFGESSNTLYAGGGGGGTDEGARGGTGGAGGGGNGMGGSQSVTAGVSGTGGGGGGAGNYTNGCSGASGIVIIRW